MIDQMIQHITQFRRWIIVRLQGLKRYLFDWLNWTVFSPYRAGVYAYIMLKVPHLSDVHLLVDPSRSGYELLTIGLSLNVQIFLNPSRGSLFIVSPLILFFLLYVEGRSKTLPLLSMSILGLMFALYLILALLELAEIDRHRRNHKEPVYFIEAKIENFSIKSRLSAFSMESFILCIWIFLSPFVLLFSLGKELDFNIIQKFSMSFPYILFILSTLGASLRPITCLNQRELSELNKTLKMHLSISFVLSMTLILLQ